MCGECYSSKTLLVAAKMGEVSLSTFVLDRESREPMNRDSLGTS